LKKRIETLEAGEGKGKGKAVSDLSKMAMDEIAEIKEIIPDMELKVRIELGSFGTVALG
jgi:hypothetical protein